MIMNDSLFTSLLTDTPLAQRRPRKGIVIGVGQVGMACAYSLVIQNTLDELVLIDLDRPKLEGEVMDLLHGSSFLEPTKITAGSLDQPHNANLVIITAGAKQQPGETRLDLVQRNSAIFQRLIPQVVASNPEAILLVVTNPVDVMTDVTMRIAGLPKSRVIGSGTVLDTARFRYLLAQQYGVDARSLHGYIIGEHGDSEVPVWSGVNIAGERLFTTPEAIAAAEPIFAEVKNAAYEIIQRKGATSYAIGLGVTQIARAILQNQKRVMTVSTAIEDFEGIGNVCLSLPAVVGRQGVERILNLSLSATEKNQLQDSAAILARTLAGLVL